MVQTVSEHVLLAGVIVHLCRLCVQPDLGVPSQQRLQSDARLAQRRDRLVRGNRGIVRRWIRRARDRAETGPLDGSVAGAGTWRNGSTSSTTTACGVRAAELSSSGTWSDDQRAAGLSTGSSRCANSELSPAAAYTIASWGPCAIPGDGPKPIGNVVSRG